MEIDAFQERSIASVIGPENGFAGKKDEIRRTCIMHCGGIFLIPCDQNIFLGMKNQENARIPVLETAAHFYLSRTFFSPSPSGTLQTYDFLRCHSQTASQFCSSFPELFETTKYFV